MIIKLRPIDYPYIKPVSILFDGEDWQAWYGYPLSGMTGEPLTFPKWAWEIVP